MINNIIKKIKYFCVDRRYRYPRIWSNGELKKFSNIFSGKIINVSAWRDDDKEGKKYKDYFINASEYFLTNISGENGLSNTKDEIYLDLEKDIPQDLVNKFDVVFNHTTLEHVFDINRAFDNLCYLSKDIIVLVIPFLQQQHWTNSYGDYWRFTPKGIIKNLENRNFKVLYLSTTPFKNNSVYIFVIATRQPEKWNGNFQPAVISDGVIKDFADINILCKFLIFFKRWIIRK